MVHLRDLQSASMSVTRTLPVRATHTNSQSWSLGDCGSRAWCAFSTNSPRGASYTTTNTQLATCKDSTTILPETNQTRNLHSANKRDHLDSSCCLEQFYFSSL